MTYTFSTTLQQKMGDKRLSARDVASKVEWSFEHIRKLCNSEAFPSKPLQKALADLLEIDQADFEKQVNADRWRAKYGKIPVSTNERSNPIIGLWDELTKDQQTTLLCVARCLVRKKRRAA